MHGSVLNFLRTDLTPKEIRGRDVLEVGSQNVNGSPREILEPYKPSSYVGVDSSLGLGVDIQLSAEDLTAHFGAASFDVVVSTEMLEHTQNWQSAIQNMKRVLRLGGLLVLTTRGPGFPFHGYPHDYWRFTPKDFQMIFLDMSILRLIPDPAKTHPGVFIKARKTRRTGTVDLSKLRAAAVAQGPYLA